MIDATNKNSNETSSIPESTFSGRYRGSCIFFDEPASFSPIYFRHFDQVHPEFSSQQREAC